MVSGAQAETGENNCSLLSLRSTLVFLEPKLKYDKTNAASQALGLPFYGEHACVHLFKKNSVSGTLAETGKTCSLPKLRFTLLRGIHVWISVGRTWLLEPKLQWGKQMQPPKP